MASEENLVLARRPSFGTSGSPSKLLSNFFKVRFNERDFKDIWLYDVDISDTKPVLSSRVCRLIMDELYRNSSGLFDREKLAYDGKKALYSVLPLVENSQEFKIAFDPSAEDGDRDGVPETEHPARRQRTQQGREKMFTIRIQFAKKLSTGAIFDSNTAKAQDALRVLDIVLKEYAARRFLVLKNSFFSANFGRPLDIGEGAETWTGYKVSLKNTQRGLTLNLDLATAAMTKKMGVIPFLQEVFGGPPLTRFSESDRRKAFKYLKGLRFECTHTARLQKNKVNEITSAPCRSLSFMMKDRGGGEKEVFMIDYYEKEYKHRMRYPDLPCINAGSKQKPKWFPLELCTILPNQFYSQKLSAKQIANLGRVRPRPDSRRNDISKAVTANNLHTDRYLQSFGLNIGTSMAAVKGRILSPPQIAFGPVDNPSREIPRDGQWNMRNKLLSIGGEVRFWAIVSCVPRLRPDDVSRIGADLSRRCIDRGIRMDVRNLFSFPLPNSHSSYRGQIDACFEAIKNKMPQKPNLIVWLLDNKSSPLYAPIKYFCEVTHGIPSQCMVHTHKGFNDQYYNNIALKINLKLGCSNWRLVGKMPKVSEPNSPTIIFGLDVSHPGPLSNSPSIAAAVATMDWPHNTTYGCMVKAQSKRLEMIKGLYEEEEIGMVEGLMMQFYKRSGHRKPSRIIVYRDGVGDSQFHEVAIHELRAFRLACKKLSKLDNQPYKPTITFLIVQKRHQTRLFYENSSNNVTPGTVVDDDICNPFLFDFYLCSQKGLIGTSRPARYNVLHDENGFTPDEIQQLTHDLCYTFGRCTRSISVAAPAYYAHLAAIHVRNYMDPDISESGSVSSAGRGGSAEPVVMALPEIHRAIKDTMFFC